MIVIALLSLVVVAVSAWWCGRAGTGDNVFCARLLEHPVTAPLLGVIGAGLVWASWGSVHPIPLVHDEIAYVLQAEIFARGAWTAVAPPISSFFEQAHVLVDPRVAAKYPPGHALMLVPGVLLGWLALMPLLLHAVSGALVFALARRVAGGAVALLTWVLWTAAPGSFTWGASYFSENTTALCWLAGWWALSRWKQDGDRRWLLLVAAATGWGAITRPLTMLAFATPVGAVVIVTLARRASLRDLALPTCVGIAILGLLPLWSARTTGDWHTTPLSVYTRDYMPWDKPGFGMDRTPARRPVPADVATLARNFGREHERHFPSALPGMFAARIVELERAVLGPPTRLLWPFTIAGLLVLDGTGMFAAGGALLLVLAYLSYATSATWTLYDLEIFPVVALLTALGMAAMAREVAKAARGRGKHAWTGITLPIVLGALTYMLVIPKAERAARAKRATSEAYVADFVHLLDQLPRKPAVVFVRNGPQHNADISLVRNSADPAREPVWIATDRGDDENRRLVRAAPLRAAYLYDERTFTLRDYPAATSGR